MIRLAPGGEPNNWYLMRVGSRRIGTCLMEWVMAGQGTGRKGKGYTGIETPETLWTSRYLPPLLVLISLAVPTLLEKYSNSTPRQEAYVRRCHYLIPLGSILLRYFPCGPPFFPPSSLCSPTPVILIRESVSFLTFVLFER